MTGRKLVAAGTDYVSYREDYGRHRIRLGDGGHAKLLQRLRGPRWADTWANILGRRLRMNPAIDQGHVVRPSRAWWRADSTGAICSDEVIEHAYGNREPVPPRQ